MCYDAWMENFIVGLFEAMHLLQPIILILVYQIFESYLCIIFTILKIHGLKRPNKWMNERIKTSRVKQENIRNMKLTYSLLMN